MVKTLIVEDNRFYRKQFRESLEGRFPSMFIEEAEEGNEALRKVEEFLPEVIFMDINLPGENGLLLTQKIKRKHPDMTVAILTSHNLPEYRETALKMGADCFMTKDTLDLNEVESCLVSCGKA